MEEIKNNERGFVGIWIPAAIWNAEDLLIAEKFVLAEINSFSKTKFGFFASNAWLADFMGLSKSRVSQILSKLRDLKYIDVTYSYKSHSPKEVDKRYITINHVKVFLTDESKEYRKSVFDELKKEFGN